ncbi:MULTISPECIES: DUF554 domain-containing protein [Atopobiaceae]|uniref:DUF554 domain-containing protein n=1 Tax=Parafannyhessea umbonata TaxID=604330 RepID=A0A1H9P5W2_9ACTN|nr:MULTISPECIES: DUF554 domain-containing protein [Atopobiaceae]SEH43107.1 hypothetical protein SAMN05216447_102129 [Parafannyhessea umbonata]SER43694.1 hypothetical protein SAMN05216446_0844 [Parafannyhessea umbonata]SJZ57486.1 hypothetical protein SAMN06298223_0789 [Olsenella sp. KH1P3]
MPVVLLGALINAVEAAVGGLIGLVFKSHVSDDLGDFLLKGQGLCVVLVGVQGMASGGSIVVVTLAVALGSLVGYLIDLDGAVNRLGDWAQRRLNAAFAGSKRLGSFSQGFVNATLFCCTGAMGIVGSLQSGIQLDHATLIAKGLIDLVVCIPFAATMGIGVPFVAVSVFVYQGVLSLLAAALGGLLTQAVITEIAVTGSLLLLAVGLNLLKLTDLKVANMLPAAFMPIALVPVMTALGLL